MLLDFYALNYSSIYLLSILLILFIENKKHYYYILIIDLILNKIPIITFVLILFCYLNMFIFKYLNKNFINKYIIIIVYYFLFSFIIYSIYNKMNIYILKYLINNIPYNLIYYYIGLKIIDWKYK